MILVSIIVPVYNAHEYIDKCVNSLLDQTIKDIEIILIDDGSTDDSLAKCQQLALKDSRVQVFTQPNSGVSATRNRGIASAVGEFVLLLDSDDWLAKNTVEELLKEQRKSCADCVVFGFKQTSGNIWAPAENKLYDTLSALKEDFPYWLNTELLSSSVNKLYKKSLIKELYPVDMAFGEDLLFSLDYLEQCSSVSFIKAPLYQHEVFNVSSLTHTFNTKRFDDIERIQRRILDFAVNKEDKALYNKYIADCTRIVRSYLASDVSLTKKKEQFDKWLSGSYFKGLSLSDFKLVWQNRLLLGAVRERYYTIANLLVNWKKIIRIQ